MYGDLQPWTGWGQAWVQEVSPLPDGHQQDVVIVRRPRLELRAHQHPAGQPGHGEAHGGEGREQELWLLVTVAAVLDPGHEITLMRI